MSDFLNLKREQIWYRILGILQQDWAFVNPFEDEIVFYDDSGYQIDQFENLTEDVIPNILSALGFIHLDRKSEMDSSIKIPEFKKNEYFSGNGKYWNRYQRLQKGSSSSQQAPNVTPLSGKSFEVTYERGHFYTKDGQKIILEANGTYTISSEKSAFYDKDPLLREYQPLSSLEKAKQILARNLESRSAKVLSAGTVFSFHTELSNTDGHDKEKRQYMFEGQILEDLYLIQNSSGHWRCASCISRLDSCSEEEMKLREPLYANSLNQLFASTITYYFGLKRSTAINVFKRFTFIVKNPLDLDILDANQYQLEYFRDLLVEFETGIKDNSKHDSPRFGRYNPKT